MVALELAVRAVILEQDQLLLVPKPDAGPGGTYELPGGAMVLGQTLPQTVAALVQAQCALAVKAVKLLYIVERFYLRGRERVQEITSYFLCEPVGGAPALPVNTAPGVIRRRPAELRGQACELAPLCELIAADATQVFAGGPKLLVINEEPATVTAVSGVFAL